MQAADGSVRALSLERDMLPKLEVGARLPGPALLCSEFVSLPTAACSQLAGGLILLAAPAGRCLPGLPPRTSTRTQPWTRRTPALPLV
jgi:hypothetical protein